MNIFYVNKVPVIAAKQLCDAHVVKMILESAQMLSTAHHYHRGSITIDYSIIYKPTHKNHPCSIWTRTNPANYHWLYQHMIGLGSEYQARYGKTHLTISKLGESLSYSPWHNFKKIINIDRIDSILDITRPPLAMPDEYKIPGNDLDTAVASYRNYYRSKKYTMKKPMKWTNTKKPRWFNCQYMTSKTEKPVKSLQLN